MGRTRKEEFVTLLRELARQLQALDDDDFDAAVSKGFTLEVNGKKEAPRGSSRMRKTKSELGDIATTLRNTTSREEAQKIIEHELPLKEDLMQLARVLDIPIQKGDTSARVQERLVEATIGYRLRSAAVQGPQTKSDT
jgi:hypothetical protein